MRVHHLNCGTMRPWGAPEGLVCHVIAIEAGTGLVLVDSGLGLADMAAPGRRFGPARYFVRPAFRSEESAIRQVESLGFVAEDVTDIILTHFDADHVGGLADFPQARVHLTTTEADAALTPRTLIERERYMPAQRAHGPHLVRHEPGDGDSWRGFAAAKELTEIGEGIVLISLPGHTRGHAAIAVDTDNGWLLHAGDAFYHHTQVDGGGQAPKSLLAMERLIAADWAKVIGNHQRLAEMWHQATEDLLIVNAHDPSLLRRAQERNRA